MKLQELIDIFGRDAILEVYDEKIKSLYQREDELESEQRAWLKLGLKLTPDQYWFIEFRLDENKNNIQHNRQLIKNFKFKRQLITGEVNSNKLIDLEIIKRIPIENFLPEPIMRGSERLHYKAPWRNESNASLIVYKRDNRFHDFGDPDKRGTVIDLIMLLEGCDFKQAVDYLKNYL